MELQKVDYFAAQLFELIQNLMNEGGAENPFRMQAETHTTEFIAALGCVVPAIVFNETTGKDVDILEFNHFANRLCFAYDKELTKKGGEE